MKHVQECQWSTGKCLHFYQTEQHHVGPDDIPDCLNFAYVCLLHSFTTVPTFEKKVEHDETPLRLLKQPPLSFLVHERKACDFQSILAERMREYTCTHIAHVPIFGHAAVMTKAELLVLTRYLWQLELKQTKCYFEIEIL